MRRTVVKTLKGGKVVGGQMRGQRTTEVVTPGKRFLCISL